ncbi:hypothetical protein SCHPADRAFT_994036 [Schizopora paradoxa]|uniref:Uncharacterized protein n=1 Tax=Schizopora paradoxa TaxID=27342 RepID=A0A0H2S1Y1_9AGAM|nr:hypothetical protein SCHPADRAFT_994036 [Schizopora paradoxa]
MTIETRSPLSLEDIKFNGLGGPVHFENTSDTIFASLFLPVSFDDNYLNSVPWQFCDRILSAIQSPHFNSKEVTFKSFGDMMCSVGARKHDTWSVVEGRPTCNASFPTVILDRVLDCLKAGMPSPTFSEEDGDTDDDEEEEDGDGEYKWTKTLKNMMLVHSSWHASVKRLLGYALVSSRGPTPTAIQNPIYGEWTREMHLRFDVDGEDYIDKCTFASTEPKIYFMNSLCARFSNVRLVNICLTESHGIVLASIRKALLDLVSLEEIIVQELFDSDELPVQRVLSAISDARHPTLRILRLHAGRFDLDNFITPISSLANLEMLHTVELLSHPLAHYRPIGVSRVLWSRDPSNRGSHFTLSDVSIDCVSESVLNAMPYPSHYEPNEGITQLLRSANPISFRFVPREEEALDSMPSSRATAAPRSISGLLGPWMAHCSSAHKVVFHELPWSHTKIFRPLHERFRALASIKELIIEVAPLSTSSKSTSSKNKEELILARSQFTVAEAMLSANLSQAIGAGAFPGLLALKVTFPESFLENYVPKFDSNDVRGGEGWGMEERRMLLPHCKQKCVERSVAFHVEIVSTKI